MIVFQNMAAAVYLAAGIAAVLGLALPAPKILRGARLGLGLGALLQAAAFATLHRLDAAPSLTDLRQVVAVMSWLGVVFTLALLVRWRLPGFVPPLAFVAFLAAFGATLSPGAGVATGNAGAELGVEASGSLPHAHVLLASAGLAALGLAGLAGLFFLIEHRALKRRRAVTRRIALPSLEALDRVNRLALVLGFPLLTLGLLTGSLWLEARAGRLWSGSLHETWTAFAWIIYLGLVGLRFVGHQGARQAAASAVAGFAFLVFAVVGSGLVS
ncbi:MAG: cytochrome c biogenesis protein CcsA [Spirochaetaceae bacterium]|nr:cytochrome c biogenesis protein CcsA [Myxococcales bacterium]MCB9726771.1 cytochrome c biogenesis protein CcsA [Spirochaetaceae bacterium]